ncbi:HEAT repeat protein [Rutstroemia sp. NJR-2017a BVV2]|nr:HEAT repeat protein [Rutstroemia sp. NJR-2017a BVV2]
MVLEENIKPADSVTNSPLDERLIPKWIESQGEDSQIELARNHFNDFLEKATQPRHASRNACIKLCYFVEQCKTSKSPGLREVAYSEETCIGLFDFYIDWNESNQHRSMRQVLDLLTSLITSHPDRSLVKTMISKIVQRLLSIITHGASQPLVKPAFKTLEHFIGKGSISVADLAASRRGPAALETNGAIPSKEVPNYSDLNEIVLEAFEWMNLQDVSPSAGKFLVSLFKASKEAFPELDSGLGTHTRLWQRWISDGLSKYPDALENVKNYLLPPLFKLDRAGSLAFLEELNSRGALSTENEHVESDFLVQLSAMEVGKKAGLVEESNTITFQKNQKKSGNCIVLQESSVGPLLTHPSEIVRSLAFSVLVSSLSTIRPFSPAALEYLRQNMGHLYADTDAKFRNEVLSNTKHLIERMRGIQKEISLADRPGQVADHATTWPYDVDIFTPMSTRLLLDLLMDPFEDVRSGASMLLRMAHRRNFESADDISETHDLYILTEFIDRARDLSKRTGRADYADGVARSYEILYRLQGSTEARMVLLRDLISNLESKVEIAKKDLTNAVLIAPIHGDFAAMNYIWDGLDPTTILPGESLGDGRSLKESFEELQVRIAASCSEIWHAVEHILCNDSPEGHIPDEVDEADTIDTKDVLSYSFRAIHESSNLMRTIVSKVKVQWGDGTPFASPAVFTKIGDLTFDQLSRLRHRGAFSTVSLTFARCSQLSQYHTFRSQITDEMLEKWYKGTLQCIYEQVSTTRRSAGIPALITGILSSNAPHPAFENVMMELKSLARRPVALSQVDETNLPQVHAMNCVKEIFKSSALGKRADKHIPDCLQLAADSLTSEVVHLSKLKANDFERWAMRNCGLLLLRSLIDCLFGTSESKIYIEAGWDGRSTKLSYEKYPALPELLLSLLDNNNSRQINASAIGAVQSVFPALDIIRRAGPPMVLRNEIETGVAAHLGSKVWHIRELAARTMCTFMLHNGWLPALKILLATSNTSTNHTHGVLMTVKFLLERRLALFASLPNIHDLLELKEDIEALDYVNNCPETTAVFVEIKNIIYQILVDSPQTSPSTTYLASLANNDARVKTLLNEYMQLYGRGAEDSRQNTSVGGALLRKAVAIETMYLSALTKNFDKLKDLYSYCQSEDTDMATAALECLPHAWSNNGVAILDGLIRPYLDSLEREDCNRNQNNDQYQSLLRGIQSCDLAQFLQDFSELKYLTLPGESSPRLFNAQLRTSGVVKLLEWTIPTDEETIRQDLRVWGESLNEAGQAHRDFDTRFAAAKALSYFFTCLPDAYQWQASLLPSLVVLYDTLNDDDDEIRELGAQTVSLILGQPLIPLAASEIYTFWLQQNFPGNQLFGWNVICRVTGSESVIYDETANLHSAEDQLSAAMKQDDALFVEEEQNLFIDEVREVKLWSKILSKLLLENNMADHLQTQIQTLVHWVQAGLEKLNVLAQETDGPLGWTSNPKMFAVCTRILLSAKTLLGEGGQSATLPEKLAALGYQDSIRKSLDTFIDLGAKNKIHPSLLAFIVDRKNSLLKRL